jgi:hypothetical protein
LALLAETHAWFSHLREFGWSGCSEVDDRGSDVGWSRSSNVL